MGAQVGPGGSGGSGGSGITNSAGANVVPKSDGTNLVASQATDDGDNFRIELPDNPAGLGASFSATNDNGDFSVGASGTYDGEDKLSSQGGIYASRVDFSREAQISVVANEAANEGGIAAANIAAFNQINLTADAAVGLIALGAPTVKVSATVTAAATVGAQTINKSAGSVNFAAGASSLVITNSTVTAASIVLATVATNDATLKSVVAVASANTITLTSNAVAAAETRVNWWVITPQ